MIEGLRICLYNNDSKFDQDHLLQTHCTATGAPKSCSYSGLVIYTLDKLIKNEQINNCHELLFYVRYRDNFFVI